MGDTPQRFSGEYSSLQGDGLVVKDPFFLVEFIGNTYGDFFVHNAFRLLTSLAFISSVPVVDLPKWIKENESSLVTLKSSIEVRYYTIGSLVLLEEGFPIVDSTELRRRGWFSEEAIKLGVVAGNGMLRNEGIQNISDSREDALEFVLWWLDQAGIDPKTWGDDSYIGQVAKVWDRFYQENGL